VQDLEAKVKELSLMVEEIQQKQAGGETLEEGHATSVGLRESLSELVRRAEADPNQEQAVTQATAKFVRSSAAQQAELDECLDRIENCFVPTPQIEFALWGADKTAQYCEGERWSSLVAALGLSHHKDLVQHLRSSVCRLHKSGDEFESAVHLVRYHVGAHTRALNGHIHDVHRVMSPVQLAKYCLWLEKNSWCFPMLEAQLGITSGNEGFHFRVPSAAPAQMEPYGRYSNA
jgi:hypothetical protein